MIPTSLSATAISVANLCLARFKASHIERADGIGNVAASLGSTVHSALELYVKAVYIDRSAQPNLKFLVDLYKMSYMTVMGTADQDSEEFADGLDMVERWYERTTGYLDTTRVISAERKDNFPLKTSIGTIPFNYIWDRFDQLDEVGKILKVVDYKSNRWGVRSEDLKKKIQPRAYAVAANIQFPEAEKIWVEFDMLRHDGPVGIMFTREQNRATLRFLQKEAQRIVDTPDDDAKETLNPECRFCLRKQTCNALLKNIAAGGVFSIISAKEAVDRRAALAYQAAAVTSAMEELDNMILAEAKETDTVEWSSDTNKLEITVSSRRSADAERVEMVIGEALFKKYGSASITMATIDRLLKGHEITVEQKAQLKSMVFNKRGEPKIKASPLNPIEED